MTVTGLMFVFLFGLIIGILFGLAYIVWRD